MSLEDEIEAALTRNPWDCNSQSQTQQHSRQPSMHSRIEVGQGEGRSTREMEIIWWPNLFEMTHHGHLTFRFFVKKTDL